MGLIQDVLDRLTGEKERQAERDRAAALQQERENQAKQQAQKEIQAKRQLERVPQTLERGPAEKLLHRDEKLQEPERKQPVKEVEATRLEHSREFQRAPSIPGMGVTFVNSRVQQSQAQAPQVEQVKPRQNLLEMAKQEQQDRLTARVAETKAEQERVAKMTPQQREADRVQKQQQQAERNRGQELERD